MCILNGDFIIVNQVRDLTISQNCTDPCILAQRLAEAYKAREAAAVHLRVSRPGFIAIEKAGSHP
jgi:hypothetical protein